MKDNGEVDQLVKVGDGGEKDGRGGGDGDQLSGPDGSEDGEQRIGIVPDGDDLRPQGKPQSNVESKKRRME